MFNTLLFVEPALRNVQICNRGPHLMLGAQRLLYLFDYVPIIRRRLILGRAETNLELFEGISAV